MDVHSPFADPRQFAENAVFYRRMSEVRFCKKFINIEDILNGISQDTVIPEENRGCDYGQYLRIMLFFQDRGIKTARILDLIQINNRAYYDKDFLVREHFTGIDIYVKANGKKYVYEKKY